MKNVWYVGTLDNFPLPTWSMKLRHDRRGRVEVVRCFTKLQRFAYSPFNWPLYWTVQKRSLSRIYLWHNTPFHNYYFIFIQQQHNECFSYFEQSVLFFNASVCNEGWFWFGFNILFWQHTGCPVVKLIRSCNVLHVLVSCSTSVVDIMANFGL